MEIKEIKNKRTKEVKKKNKKLITIGLKLFITYQWHIGHREKVRNKGVLRDYIIGYFAKRVIYNPNIMIIEIRRMLGIIRANSYIKGGIIIHVPRKRLEGRISNIDIRDGDLGANIENIMDDLRRRGIRRYSIITRWVGGLISNYKFIKKKTMIRHLPKHRGIREKEKQMGQLISIIDPSIYVGFTEEGSAENEARLVGLKSFIFIDTDYRDTIKEDVEKHIRVKIPINLSVKVISTLITIIDKNISKEAWKYMRYTEEERYMAYITSYRLISRRRFFHDEKARIAYEIKKIKAKKKLVKFLMYKQISGEIRPFIKC